jgi:hypothetical protein
MGLGCDSQPTITLTAVGCRAADVTLTATVSKRRNASQTITKVEVEVKCMGEGLPEAEIHVDFWGLFSRTVKTDDKGMASASQVTQADTGGLQVTVTIEGSDGAREVVVEAVPQ